MEITPYLIFEGRCEEAIQHYKQTLGAKVEMLMRYKDAPPEAREGCPQGADEKVMHAALRIGEALLMASDGRCTGQTDFKGVSVSVSVESSAQVDQFCNALADGGQVFMAPAQTFFAKRFGMVADKFGLPWMFIVQQ